MQQVKSSKNALHSRIVCLCKPIPLRTRVAIDSLVNSNVKTRTDAFQARTPWPGAEALRDSSPAYQRLLLPPDPGAPQRHCRQAQRRLLRKERGPGAGSDQGCAHQIEKRIQSVLRSAEGLLKHTPPLFRPAPTLLRRLPLTATMPACLSRGWH